MDSTYGNVTGLSILVGLGGGIDVLAAQAHGAGAAATVGAVLQRALCIQVGDGQGKGALSRAHVRI